MAFVVALGIGALWAGNVQAATFLVTNAKDSGPGSLRDAITKANLTTAADTIKFAIPIASFAGTNVHVISLQTQLPKLTAPVTIDGTSQPGYIGLPLIQLDDGCACVNDGLELTATHSKVIGLSITGFNSDGVQLDDTASQTVIAGNWIGLDPSGVRHSNGTGIDICSPGNLIGGTTPATRNVISGNGFGIDLSCDTTKANVISGNYVGVDPSGERSPGASAEGIHIEAGASGNKIGGTSAGSRNVISGNGKGVFINTNPGTAGNVVQGNYIGTDTTGTFAITPTQSYGVVVEGGTGNSVTRNVISGNSTGVRISSTTTANVVSANLIGTDAGGTGAVPNQNGILVNSSQNIIGGSSPAAGNVVSGNLVNGVAISGDVNGNAIEANLIGVTKSGAPLGNGCRGVLVENMATANTIGGTTVGERNVISGNGLGACSTGTGGIDVYAATGTVISGNFIGTNATGTAKVGNGGGVRIEAGSANNVVGGTTPASRNVISGNLGDGIAVEDTGSTGNLIEGNFVGTTASGSTALPNEGSGVFIESDAANNIVGGTTAGARNVLSGNLERGISVYSSGNSIEGNFIGTNASGSAAVGNACAGVLIDSSTATGNTVGGSVPGARNVISGNGLPGYGCDGNAFGIWVFEATGTTIAGNFIGTNASGTGQLGNLGSGIMLDDGANTTQIGGPTVAGRNVISGNRDDGIDLVFTAHDNDIVDNFIGTNVSGTAPLGNLNFGIYDQATGTGNRIGDDSDPNVIAFNGATTGADGIRVNGALGAYGLEIAGNSIFSNGGLGIALTNNGNNDLPSPDITSVATAAGKTTIDGTYLAPADNYLIEVFANSACDPSGGGEGRKFLNEVQVSTAAGLAHWELVVPALSPGMKIVTATAIRGSTADTSQFSACKS